MRTGKGINQKNILFSNERDQLFDARLSMLLRGDFNKQEFIIRVEKLRALQSDQDNTDFLKFINHTLLELFNLGDSAKAVKLLAFIFSEPQMPLLTNNLIEDKSILDLIFSKKGIMQQYGNPAGIDVFWSCFHLAMESQNPMVRDYIFASANIQKLIVSDLVVEDDIGSTTIARFMLGVIKTRDLDNIKYLFDNLEVWEIFIYHMKEAFKVFKKDHREDCENLISKIAIIFELKNSDLNLQLLEIPEVLTHAFSNLKLAGIDSKSAEKFFHNMILPVFQSQDSGMINSLMIYPDVMSLLVLNEDVVGKVILNAPFGVVDHMLKTDAGQKLVKAKLEKMIKEKQNKNKISALINHWADRRSGETCSSEIVTTLTSREISHFMGNIKNPSENLELLVMRVENELKPLSSGADLSVSPLGPKSAQHANGSGMSTSEHQRDDFRTPLNKKKASLMGEAAAPRSVSKVPVKVAFRRPN